jgi:streptomycin 6-kinase
VAAGDDAVMSLGSAFDRYLALWGLTPDGEPIVTRGARLLPVRRGGEAAMLKVATETEEKFGGVLMRWWDGQGAARVLAADADALLLERAEGRRSLSAMARAGQDNEAAHILCDVVAALHAPRPTPLPELIPLEVWFRELWPAAATHGGVLARSAMEARALLDSSREAVPLHGDIHHDNVLDFGPRGWLAIDPKRLHGERGFDYANIFTNPDLSDPSPPVAIRPERFASRLEIVAARAEMERRRLLQWIVAWTGLSAAWFLGDGDSAEIDLTVARFAVAALDG